ncbi:MAG: hypothetical protein V1891_00390 [bacterium]
MLLLIKFLIFASSALIFILFNAISFSPRYFFLWGALMIIIAILISFFILRKKTCILDKFLFMISPIFFILSSLFASIFLNNSIYKFIFFIAISYIIFLYLENLFAYFHAPAKYNIYSLENISGYINLASIFFISFGAYGIKVLFGMNIYWVVVLAIITFAIFFLFYYQMLWVNKISISETGKYFFATGLILMEIYLAIFLLPGSFYTAGAIFAIAYYVLMGIVRLKLLDKLDRKNIIKYLSIGSLMFLLLMITTRWM